MLYALPLLLCCCLALTVGCVHQDGSHPEPLRDTSACRAMTFNIRVATSADGPNHWNFRREAVGQMLNDLRPDILSVQEARHSQAEDLAAMLPAYEWYGIGRDGGDNGEFNPLFIRKDRFEFLDKGHFWLAADSTDKPVVGWDAALTRVAVWAKLRDRITNETIVALSAHFDHRGKQSRLESMKLVKQRMETLANGRPIVLLGDFNARPETDAYQFMVSESSGFRDARLVSRKGHTGPVDTFTGFHGDTTKKPMLVDYVFISPHWQAIQTRTVESDWNGRQMSDHRAYFADLRLSHWK